MSKLEADLSGSIPLIAQILMASPRGADLGKEFSSRRTGSRVHCPYPVSRTAGIRRSSSAETFSPPSRGSKN